MGYLSIGKPAIIIIVRSSADCSLNASFRYNFRTNRMNVCNESEVIYTLSLSRKNHSWPEKHYKPAEPYKYTKLFDTIVLIIVQPLIGLA